jgi:hypothetical protein
VTPAEEFWLVIVLAALAGTVLIWLVLMVGYVLARAVATTIDKIQEKVRR